MRAWSRACAGVLGAALGCGGPNDAPNGEIDQSILTGHRRPFSTATVRVSVSSRGTEADRDSSRPGVSGDGRVVGFVSLATNLVPGDTNEADDIYVHHRGLRLTERVSVSSEGAEADLLSDVFPPALDRRGRSVAFESLATNLVPGDTNGEADVFLRDRRAGTTERLSVADDGAQGNGASASPAISAGGRLVAFISLATNLVPSDGNGRADVFVRDRRRGSTSRVSIADDGTEGNGDAFSLVALSGNGRFVAFATRATNLSAEGVAGVLVHDRLRRATELASVSSSGAPGSSGAGAGGVSLSHDGRFVAFDSDSSDLVPGDTNGVTDVFVRDLRAHKTERVCVGPGRIEANGASLSPSLSGDGRFVAFVSTATNLAGLAAPESHAYVHDRLTKRTRLVSVAPDGTPGNGATLSAALSSDGRVLVSWSLASNLVAADGNGAGDIFVHTLGHARRGHHRGHHREHRGPGRRH